MVSTEEADAMVEIDVEDCEDSCVDNGEYEVVEDKIGVVLSLLLLRTPPVC